MKLNPGIGTFAENTKYLLSETNEFLVDENNDKLIYE
jgi:hypothetical protein